MNRNDEQELQAFAQSLRQLLRQSEQVDGNTARRLARARQRALSQAPQHAPAGWRWVVLAGIAAVAVTLSTGRFTAPGTAPAGHRHADTLELLTDENDPQFYRDLEFYEWLQQQQPHA